MKPNKTALIGARARRILLILLTSTGIVAATAWTAEAGRELNHCEQQLPR
ncbi:hypothetical protein GCM10022236_47370 [Microlunatus ginsengisoli]|uniref:Secreted protein n=2 Tax=Microlunatus ginsengisoli TaxID=363863 RepID=A0ABP7AT69_9ACTN